MTSFRVTAGFALVTDTFLFDHRTLVTHLSLSSCFSELRSIMSLGKWKYSHQFSTLMLITVPQKKGGGAQRREVTWKRSRGRYQVVSLGGKRNSGSTVIGNLVSPLYREKGGETVAETIMFSGLYDLFFCMWMIPVECGW
jgi:hypothetical protein